MDHYTDTNQPDIIKNTCDALTITARDYWNKVLEFYHDFFTKTICIDLASKYNIDIKDILVVNGANKFRDSVPNRLRTKLESTLSIDITALINAAIEERLLINILDVEFDCFEVKLLDNHLILAIRVKDEEDEYIFTIDCNTSVVVAVNKFIQKLTGEMLLANGGEELIAKEPTEESN
jgi:hypothetical protein